MLFDAACQRSERRQKAGWIDAVAWGYTGSKSEKGGKAMQQEIERLRK